MNLAVHTSGHGPVDLVLLHGWGFSAAMWSWARDTLDPAFRLWCVDLPGHGDSPPWPPPYTAQDVADVLVARLPAAAIWLGWSLGGIVALAAAARAEPRALCLLATNPRFVASDDWPWGVDPTVMAGFQRLLGEDPERLRRRFLALCAPSASERRYLARSTTNWDAPPQALASGLDLLRTADLRRALPHVGCPATWLFGDADPLVDSGISDHLRLAYPRFHCRRLRGGHGFFLSRPTSVTTALRALLDHD